MDIKELIFIYRHLLKSSFRSEKVASMIQSILENENDQAAQIYQDIKHNYPIKITRDLAKAKAWLKHQARGTERIGLIASSGAKD